MPRRNRRQHQVPRYVLPKDGSTFLGTQEMEGPSWTNGEIFKVRQIGSAVDQNCRAEANKAVATMSGGRGASSAANSAVIAFQAISGRP